MCVLALVLDRAKKKAQEARAGLDERYSRRSGEISPTTSPGRDAPTEEAAAKLEAKVIPSRWESRWIISLILLCLY